jgi:lysozyme family protein
VSASADSQYERCLAFTLQQEGGYVDNPKDPGGATNQGITLAVYRQWCHDPGKTAADLHAIDHATVAAIYSSNYWSVMQCHAMPAGLDLMVFDQGVNSGCGRSVQLLQQALGFPQAAQDGLIGPHTLGFVSRAEITQLIDNLGAAQEHFYRNLPLYPTFGRGWTARVQRRIAAAHAMKVNS